jgi:hypothetical protein
LKVVYFEKMALFIFFKIFKLITLMFIILLLRISKDIAGHALKRIVSKLG